MTTVTREMAVEWLRELGWRFAPEYGSEIVTHDDAVFVVDGGGHKEDATPYMVNLMPLIQKAYQEGRIYQHGLWNTGVAEIIEEVLNDRPRVDGAAGEAQACARSLDATG